MNNISLLLAFSAGLLSFLSPCVLPLVPAYITYLTGSGIQEMNEGKKKLLTLYKSLGFVIGFSIVFIIMGTSVSALGQIFTQNKELFRKVGGILIILFGLHTTGLFKIKMLYYEKRILPFGKKTGRSLGSVFMGMAFAAGWTPCVGPILSSILIYAGSMETLGRGVALLVAYSMGMAVPFILTALAIENLSGPLRKINKYLPAISVFTGVVLVVMGILIYTNKINILSGYLNFINF